MAAERVLVDTNVLVRFFTGDPPEQAGRARALVGRADDGEVTVLSSVSFWYWQIIRPTAP